MRTLCVYCRAILDEVQISVGSLKLYTMMKLVSNYFEPGSKINPRQMHEVIYDINIYNNYTTYCTTVILEH